MSKEQKGVFEKWARTYTNRGLWPRPITPGSKACKELKWTDPGSDRTDHWLSQHLNHGIGLLMGTPLPDGTCLAALDIDNDNYRRLGEVVLNDPPSGRFGSKGAVFFVRLAGKLTKQAYKVGEAADGEKVAEWLAEKRLCVIPPTTHPDTEKPYEWIGVPLHEIAFEKLPLVGGEEGISLELIRAAFTSTHYSELFSGSDTHDAMLRLVAQLVRHTTDDDIIRRIVGSGLPKGYSGNTLDEVQEAINSAREKGFGNFDLGNGKKASGAELLLQIVQQSETHLFEDQMGRAFITVQNVEGATLHHPIKSNATLEWLRIQYLQATNKLLSQTALHDVAGTLEAIAKSTGEKLDTHVRIARQGNTVYFDLGRRDGVVVVITTTGWELTNQHPIKFYRGNGFGELPLPETNGDINELRKLLQLDENNWVLLLAFILNCLKPEGPYMCLLVDGEQGSGKSMLSEVAKRIVDPQAAMKSRLPATMQDLMIQAKEFHLLVYDNASGIKYEMSDALCTLATGGGMATRELYSNDGLFIFDACRPFAINGIGEFANRPDLLDRAISLSLPALEAGKRKSEKKLNEQFDRILPGVMGALFDIVAAGLRNEGITEEPTDFRMADSLAWLNACEPGTSLAPGTFAKVIKRGQEETMIDRVMNQPLAIALRELLDDEDFQGTIGDLHSRLQSGDPHQSHLLPKAASGLSTALSRLSPSLLKAGIEVSFGDRTRKGKLVSIRLVDRKSADQGPEI